MQPGHVRRGRTRHKPSRCGQRRGTGPSFLADEGQWPQSLRTIISADGTSLYVDKTATRGFREVAWNRAGSGCGPDLRAAVDQPATISGACHGRRAASGISAVADPYTGVAVYDSYAPFTAMPYGFIVAGGTSGVLAFPGGPLRTSSA